MGSFKLRMHQNPFSAGAPDPAGGAYDAPPDPLVGWGGGQPFPIPPRRLRRLDLAAIPLLLKEIYANGYISVCKSTAVV